LGEAFTDIDAFIEKKMIEENVVAPA